MHIMGLFVLKCRSNGSEDPVILAKATDISRFSYFDRDSVDEFIVFICRTVAARTEPGQHQTVEHQEYKVHAHNRNGLCAVAFMDDHYPVRSAFSMLDQVLDTNTRSFGEVWRFVQVDRDHQPWTALNEYLARFQDPAEIDNMSRIQRELDETSIILVSRVNVRAKAAVEAAGGTVRRVYYNKLGLRALHKPEWFDKKGRLLSRPARPLSKQKDKADSIGCLPAPIKPIPFEAEENLAASASPA